MENPEQRVVSKPAEDGESGRKPRLLKSSLVVSCMTMISRVLGLLRDVVFALTIGATGAADAFFVAFKIPNFLRRLFAEGAFSQAFVPVLAEYKHQGSYQAVKGLVDRVAGTMGSVLVLLTVLVVMGSPVVATVFAPGFWDEPEKFQLTTELIRITFPYLLLISMTGLAGGILNSYDRFAVPAFTPVLLNLSLILAALVGAPWFEQPVYALAWGVMIAGVVQLVFQLPFLARINMLPTPVLDWQDSGVRKVLKLMLPAMFGVSVSQLNLLLDTVIASLLPNGSVSWLYYSDRLSELPLGVFAVAVATVILPNLSRQHAEDSAEQFNKMLNWALRFILLISIPAALALIVLARPILMTLFFYGDVMSERDIDMAVLSLRAYASGLVAFMLIKVLAPGFYARQDMKTPVRIGVIAMVSNMFLNVLFVVPLHLYYQVGHVGLALATAVSAGLNALLLFGGLKKRAVFSPEPGWYLFAVRVFVANAAMITVLILLQRYVDGWLIWQWWERSLVMAAICLAGLFIYCLCLFLSGMRVSDLRHRTE